MSERVNQMQRSLDDYDTKMGQLTQEFRKTFSEQIA